MIELKYFLLLLFSLAICPSKAQDTLNPLKGGIGVHDPVMIKEGDTYYVFHTGNSISVKTSKDRITWKKDSAVFSKKDMPA